MKEIEFGGKTMLDLKRQEKIFKDHIAELTKHEKITILDFRKPNSSHYRIRFLFEEDYCRLHISGDLGELTATNYSNMRYEHFGGYINNAAYFREKIDCMSREAFTYCKYKAEKDLLELIKEYELEEDIIHIYEDVGGFIEDALEDFSDRNGIGARGYDVASKCIKDFWECEDHIGKESTGIVELYLLAFKLAASQIKI